MKTLPNPQFHTFEAGEDIPDEEKTMTTEKLGDKICVASYLPLCHKKEFLHIWHNQRR